jgi:hypothetical protein
MFERKHWILFLLVVLVVLLMVLAVPVGGRKGRQMSASGEKSFSGTVEAVNQHTCEICKCVEVSATVKTGDELLEVRLGPKTFLEEHDFHLSRGDSIEVTGLRFNERGKEVVLANEVRKAGEKLDLRGKYGRPVWIAAHGHTCPVCGN